jgi:hypothetical protein
MEDNVILLPNGEQASSEQEEQEEELTENPDKGAVHVSLHPLGGLAIVVRDSISGEQSQSRLTIQQAWELSGHITALTNMLVQAAYTQMLMDQQTPPPPKMTVPRGRK